MGFKQDFYDIPRGFFGEFYGISMMFFWNFYGGSMILSIGLRLDSCGVSMVFLRYFYGITIGDHGHSWMFLVG